MGLRPIARAGSEPFEGASEVMGVRGPPGVYDVLDFAGLPMAVMEGPGQTLRYVNPAFCHLTGKSDDEMMGRPLAEMLPEGDKCLALLDRVYRTGQSESYVEPEGARPHPLYWAYELWPVFNEAARGDGPAGVVLQVTKTASFQRRITGMNEALMLSAVRQHELIEGAEELHVQLRIEMKERMLAEAALIQSEKLAAVGRLASSIAHEINNPLESVMNLLYLARQHDNIPEVQLYLNTADMELQRVAVIVSQTLRFHKQMTKPQAIGCSELFSTVLSIYEGRLKNSNIRVEKRKRAHDQIVCMEGEIRQVLNNLVGNAIDAMPSGGRLLVRSRQGTDWRTGRAGLVMTVADTGIGMDAGTQAKIFQAFFTTKGFTGTGLGLWISAEIVARHQGRIRVRSGQRENHRGTVVALFLPFTGMAAA